MWKKISELISEVFSTIVLYTVHNWDFTLFYHYYFHFLSFVCCDMIKVFDFRWLLDVWWTAFIHFKV